MNRISALVKYHRKKAGLTQLELADMAGIGKTTVFDIEHGKSTVQLKSLLSVLEILNIRLELIGPFSEEFTEHSAKSSQQEERT